MGIGLEQLGAVMMEGWHGRVGESEGVAAVGHDLGHFVLGLLVHSERKMRECFWCLFWIVLEFV